jgi:hypothetical protein
MKSNRMPWRWLALLGATLLATHAFADVWKASPRGAKFNAHYLINSETGAVVSMREDRCLRSFAGTIGKDGSGAPRVTVDAEIGEGSGPRGRQKMVFVLREGSGGLSVASTLRGAQPPLPVDYTVSCRGKTCTTPACG